MDTFTSYKCHLSVTVSAILFKHVFVHEEKSGKIWQLRLFRQSKQIYQFSINFEKLNLLSNQ